MMARKKTTSADEESRFAPLTENGVRAQTDSSSYSRGRGYFRGQRIRETVLRDTTIEALCQGSDFQPYQVKATLARQGERGENPRTASCTCPRGGFCKHVVALLLTWIDNSEQFVARPLLADVLAERSPAELIALIGRMVQRYPDLERLVELPLPVSPDASGPPNVVTIDEAIIRRQIRSAFVNVDPWEWDAGDEVVTELAPLLELGRSYRSTGQWANAQVVFTALAEEVSEWMLNYRDETGEVYGVVIDCDEGLAACLDAQADLPESDRLSDEARTRLIQSMYDIWYVDIFYIGGIDLSQHGPDAIARNVTGKEREMVEEWLRGEETESDWSKRSVIGFRVMLREEAGLSDEELLAVYREAELWDDVALMLLEMDHVDEAVATARRHLTNPVALRAFATALISRGGPSISRALTLIDDYLWEKEGTNPVQETMLQDWLIVQFTAHDRSHDALPLAEKRFKRQPTMQTYLAVRDAARHPSQPEGTWSELRSQLHDYLRAQNIWSMLMEIHRDEGDIKAALDAFARQSRQNRTGVGFTAWGYENPALHLAKAAEQDFPDEAVSIYHQLAEGMINHRQRASYKVAAAYLARVKETLERHDRLENWQTFITDLRTSHKTLRALREELDALDLR